MQPQPRFRTGALPSLHDQAWNLWRNSEPYHIRPADVLPGHIERAKAIIEEDSTAIMHEDAADIAEKWDDLIMEIGEHNGFDILSTPIIAFNPFEDRFMLVNTPPLP